LTTRRRAALCRALPRLAPQRITPHRLATHRYSAQRNVFPTSADHGRRHGGKTTNRSPLRCSVPRLAPRRYATQRKDYSNEGR